MLVKTLVIFAAFVAAAVSDNSGCPHPEESKNMVLQKIIIVDAPVDGRHIEHIELPREILGRSDFSCITVVAGRKGSTPDFVSFGRNDQKGYSIVLHSRIRNPMNATVYLYTQ